MPSDWDSSLFGLRIGRLVPGADERTNIEQVAVLDRSSFDCVWVDLALEAAPLLHRWSDLGAHPVDVRIELALSLAGRRSDPPPASVEAPTSWAEHDRHALVSLAIEQSAWSRLARDPAFAAAVPRMYERWVGNVFSGHDEALVWREGGRIVGMLTTRPEPPIAWLELLDVHADGRGRGIGGALVREFLRRAALAGHREARVRTQLRNAAAIRTYERAGFAFSHATFVLHWWSTERSGRAGEQSFERA